LDKNKRGTSLVVESAVNYFKDGLYCSEAILKAFNEHYKLGLTDEFLKIATGFGAGLGASKCCCGSLTGGIMVLSLVTGRSSVGESETPAFDTVSALHDRFRRTFGATCCRVLTRPVEWGSPEHHEYCVQFVRGASEMTEDILRENPIKFQKNIAV
jgi:C_GCAxxG_C_C family probable redox protein